MTAALDIPDTTHSARWIEALDRQAMIIMAIYARAGFEPIAPPIIQPADIFLDLIGEDLRARTYVFVDPDGAELCLRPDLTIPACRLYLDRFGAHGAPARLAYNGVVFRYQPEGSDAARPREFRQAGIESFGAADPAKADAEIFAMSVESVRAAGLRSFRLHVGDLGILHAILDGIAMPPRWRQRLRHHFWRPDAFRQHLKRLTHPEAKLVSSLITDLQGVGPGALIPAVGNYLDKLGLVVQGTRTIEEIAEHLAGMVEDSQAEPLSPKAVEFLDAYLDFALPVEAAPDRIRNLARTFRVDLSPAVEQFEMRLKLAAEEGIDLSQATFSGGFGRAFEYYTGFVFEIRSALLGEHRPICGGGRYDTLVAAISGGKPIPAVGAAIHTERLLLAVRGGQL